MESIKRTVRVNIEKEIEIEFPSAFFGNMTEAEYLEEFRKGLWKVDGIDDVVKYAARMAATCGGGYQHDGLGLLDLSHSTYPRVPDVKFREIYEECEEEILTPNALGEGRERGILREASSGEAATSTDGLEGKGRSDAG